MIFLNIFATKVKFEIRLKYLPWNSNGYEKSKNIVKKMQQWNEQKQRSFLNKPIQIALHRLKRINN